MMNSHITHITPIISWSLECTFHCLHFRAGKKKWTEMMNVRIVSHITHIVLIFHCHWNVFFIDFIIAREKGKRNKWTEMIWHITHRTYIPIVTGMYCSSTSFSCNPKKKREKQTCIDNTAHECAYKYRTHSALGCAHRTHVRIFSLLLECKFHQIRVRGIKKNVGGKKKESGNIEMIVLINLHTAVIPHSCSACVRMYVLHSYCPWMGI